MTRTREVFLVVGVLLTVGACSGAKLKEALAEGTYLGQQLDCVDKNATRKDIDECRATVRKRWGIVTTVRDGGADQ